MSAFAFNAASAEVSSEIGVLTASSIVMSGVTPAFFSAATFCANSVW